MMNWIYIYLLVLAAHTCAAQATRLTPANMLAAPAGNDRVLVSSAGAWTDQPISYVQQWIGNGTDVWRSTGNVMFGTSTNSGERLQVAGKVKIDNGYSQGGLEIRSGAGGYTSANILLASYGTAGARGLGTFMYDENSDIEWFIGRPYNDNDKLIFARKANQVAHSTDVADGGNNVFELTAEAVKKLGSNPYYDIATTGGGSNASPAISGVRFSSSSYSYKVASIEGMSFASNSATGVMRFNVASNIGSGTIDEAMRIIGGGRVLIATTIDNAVDKLQVNGSTAISGTLKLGSTFATISTGTAGGQLQLYNRGAVQLPTFYSAGGAPTGAGNGDIWTELSSGGTGVHRPFMRANDTNKGIAFLSDIESLKGKVSAAGSLVKGVGITVFKSSTGIYDVSLVSPAVDANYTILLTAPDGIAIGYSSQNINGFTVVTRAAGTLTDSGFMVQILAR